jgi:hypothetical protein
MRKVPSISGYGEIVRETLRNISRSCKNDHIIFNVGTPSLEARNIKLVNIITYIIEESKLISENNVAKCHSLLNFVSHRRKTLRK